MLLRKSTVRTYGEHSNLRILANAVAITMLLGMTVSVAKSSMPPYSPQIDPTRVDILQSLLDASISSPSTYEKNLGRSVWEHGDKIRPDDFAFAFPLIISEGWRKRWLFIRSQSPAAEDELHLVIPFKYVVRGSGFAAEFVAGSDVVVSWVFNVDRTAFLELPTRRISPSSFSRGALEGKNLSIRIYAFDGTDDTDTVEGIPDRAEMIADIPVPPIELYHHAD